MNNKDINIIKASIENIEVICMLEKSIFSDSERFSRRRLRYLLKSANAAIFVCYSNSEGIGYGISLLNRLTNCKYKGRIYSIGILPEWQRKEIGSSLLIALEDWLIKAGSDFITLETRSDKGGAASFFEKHGYVRVQYLRNYYQPYHGIRMRKDIK